MRSRARRARDRVPRHRRLGRTCSKGRARDGSRLCCAASPTLAAFRTDLGDLMADVCVLTMSEFGRTVAENGSTGTDHSAARR